MSRKNHNTLSVRERAGEFSLQIQDKFSSLSDEDEEDIKEATDKLT